MNAPIKRFVRFAHQSLPPWATIILMAPVLFLVASAAADPFGSITSGRLPWYVLSGRLFTDRFDIVHAGSVLDQPTIGKWLFWFTVITTLSLPYAAMVGWISNRKTPIGRLAFAIPVAVICFLLLCILTWPICWLIQYVHSMGFTPRRIYGLLYASLGVAIMLLLLIWAARLVIAEARACYRRGKCAT